MIRLTDNAASSARGVHLFVVLNSIREFVKWDMKSRLHSEIIWPNYETSDLLDWKTLLVVLKSTTKSTLSINMSLADFVRTNASSSSHTHVNTCKIQSLRKRAFMLHLTLPCCGHFHCTSKATLEKELNCVVLLLCKVKE